MVVERLVLDKHANVSRGCLSSEVSSLMRPELRETEKPNRCKHKPVPEDRLISVITLKCCRMIVRGSSLCVRSVYASEASETVSESAWCTGENYKSCATSCSSCRVVSLRFLHGGVFSTLV